MRRLLVVPFALAVAVVPASAIEPPLDTEEVLGEVLTTVAADSGVPVRVPDMLPLDLSSGRIYAEGEGRPRGYEIAIAGAPDCGGANACSYGFLEAQRGAILEGRRNVRLRKGIRGVFRPLACGASCSPPSISWRQRGVLYVMSLKAAPGTRRQFIRLANSAISATPR